MLLLWGRSHLQDLFSLNSLKFNLQIYLSENNNKKATPRSYCKSCERCEWLTPLGQLSHDKDRNVRAIVFV